MSFRRKLLCLILSGSLFVRLVLEPSSLGAFPRSQADLSTAAAEMERMFAALEEALRELPRASFDVHGVLEETGNEPTKIFQWVRDNTSWAPYRGYLRGSRGVLMDRLGSSLDRSLLLAELLSSTGLPARLAHAAISKEKALQALSKVRPLPPVSGGPATADRDGKNVLPRLAKKFQLDQPRLQRILDSSEVGSGRLAEDLFDRVRDQTQALRELLGELPPAINQADSQERYAQTLQDHWWVQVFSEGRWGDLDPLLPDAMPGEALSPPSETFEARGEDLPARLKSEVCHQVRVSVIIERWSRGKLTEIPVLSRNLRPAQILGDPIVLSFLPEKWPDDKDFSSKDGLDSLEAALLDCKEWTPILSVGSARFAQSAFTITGEVREASSSSEAAAIGKKVGGALGGFGKALGSEPSSPEGAGVLSAAWIDYEILSPGEKDRTVRRPVFDLLGPSARASKVPGLLQTTRKQELARTLSFAGGTELLLCAGGLSRDYLTYLASVRTLKNRNELPSLLRDSANIGRKQLSARASRLVPPPGLLYELAAVRAEWQRQKGETYLDRPNIFTLHSELRKEERRGLILRHGFDIVSNDVAVRPGLELEAFRARLEQGVFDTNAEALLLAGGGKAENTAESFVSRAAQGIPWVLLRSASDPRWNDLSCSPDFRANIEKDFAQGCLVVFPRRSEGPKDQCGSGWWRIETDTGQTLGMGVDGRGQATTENAVIVIRAPIMSILCMGIAAADQGGLTLRDGLVCALGVGGGSLSCAGKLLGHIAAICVALGTGIWLNDRKVLD